MATKPKQTAKPKRRKTAARRRAAKVKEHFDRHYYALMPKKKHHRVLVWTVFLALAMIIVAQMLYPVERVLPFASLGGQPVGW